MKKKDNKFKIYYKKFKEAWAVPQKRAGIKLLGYFVMFFVLLLLAGIFGRIDTVEQNYNTTTTTTTNVVEKEDKYNDKKDSLINNKHSINYDITIEDSVYKINGSIENNIINGYLETSDVIKKIIVENDIIYEIKNNEKIQTDNVIDFKLINLNNLIEIMNTNTFIIENIDDNKNYIYKLDDINQYNIDSFKVFTNDKNIYKIEINQNANNYVLNFDVD